MRILESIHLWNPSIRESACFPIKKIPSNLIVCFWFGIHDDEYKLVLDRRMHDDDDEEYQMHLIRPYVGSHSYKSTTLDLRKEDHLEFYRKRGTLFNGNVQWAVCVSWTEYLERDWRQRTYLCYNLREGRIPVPTSEAHRELGEIDGCFSALFMVESGG